MELASWILAYTLISTFQIPTLGVGTFQLFYPNPLPHVDSSTTSFEHPVAKVGSDGGGSNVSLERRLYLGRGKVKSSHHIHGEPVCWLYIYIFFPWGDSLKLSWSWVLVWRWVNGNVVQFLNPRGRKTPRDATPNILPQHNTTPRLCVTCIPSTPPPPPPRDVRRPGWWCN